MDTEFNIRSLFLGLGAGGGLFAWLVFQRVALSALGLLVKPSLPFRAVKEFE